MALQKRVTKIAFGQELVFRQAYCQVTNIVGNKSRIDLTLSIYDNESKSNFLEAHNYSFTPSVEEGAPNFIKQAYEHLTTLEDYKDAIEV